MSCLRLDGNLTGSAEANLATQSIAGKFQFHPLQTKTLMVQLVGSAPPTSLQGLFTGSLVTNFRPTPSLYYSLDTQSHHTFELTGTLSASLINACIFFPPLA